MTGPPLKTLGRQLLLRRVLRAYDAALQRMPLRTKAVTASLISATGDCMVQQLSKIGDVEIDGLRLARQAVWSFFLSPFVHLEYNVLARVPPVGPIPAKAVSVMISQLCFSPMIHVAYFGWVSSASSGFSRSLREVRADVDARLWPALQASFVVWPAATLFNLAYVAMPYRVLFTNVVGMGYGMLMSWMANGGPCVHKG